ncbi:small nuclear ribonucleoprotein SmD3b-like isoform X2 [Diospyros lotus]|uniref:small nuclear ribonucleoprotein SmD3b-like isoform X2 n=1 Tax=Diospyros lotus TaxID=55363 RepID=UPI00224FAAB6|nr:small nuclear ribonucleoprotein SmD3b-like isoform X2 [Diospyros lotus]
MSRTLGIPVKLLHEATGHVVTVEIKSGELYRGNMVECEDNWNCQLENIAFTAKDGKVSQLEHVFIRGSKVRFMVIPDMLKNAPMFKRLESRIKAHPLELAVVVLLQCALELRLLGVELHLVGASCPL